MGKEVLKFSNVQCWYRSGIPAALQEELRSLRLPALAFDRETRAVALYNSHAVIGANGAPFTHQRLLLSFEDGYSVGPSKDFVLFEWVQASE